MKIDLYIFLCIVFSLSLSSYSYQTPTERLGIETIENELFDLINRERAKEGVPLLQISKNLISLARSHSQDMVARSELTHISSDGKTYADRLKEAGYFFRGTGENIALSQSFLPEAIHESFMRSDGHRENILDPRFDRVGIGVFFKEDEGYYITQDFLASLQPKSEKELRDMLRKRFNHRRAQKGLSPILLLEELNILAREFSQKRAKGEPLPDLPDGYGEILYLLISTPLLELEEKDMQIIIDPATTRAGIGIYFAREEKNPGGTYFISFLLLRKSVTRNMSADEIRRRLADEINSFLIEKGERQVKLDKALSDEARVIAETIRSKGGRSFVLSPQLSVYQVIPYSTDNPLRLPEKVKFKLNYIRIRRVGIGLAPVSDGKKPPEKYWVVILFY